jgi:hypothetical protein
MKVDNRQHLDDQELIRAVVDAADLPNSVQAHLAACRLCLTAKNRFQLELQTLSQKAERLAPHPQRRILLPALKTKKTLRNLRDWHTWTAAAATVTAVLLIVWGTHFVRHPATPESGDTAAEMAEAERFMTEVNTLVDNALPPFYLEISGEKNADYDQEFYEFLIPTIGDQSLTSEHRRKGTSLC